VLNIRPALTFIWIMNTLLIEGLMTELDYMTADEQAEARALEAELIADAEAGVDLRIRLVGRAASVQQ
jgi:hypothetical protein